MRVIDAVLDPDRADALRERAERCEHDVIELSRTDDHIVLRVLVMHSDPDEFLEGIRKDLREDGRDPKDAHYAVFEPLAIEPKPDPEEEQDEEEHEAGTDEIESFVDDGAKLTTSFVVLSALSGVMAAGGLILDNVAIIVGAMVLAPLFKPLALVGVATVLGDAERMVRSLALTTLSLAMSAVVGGVITLVTPGVEVTPQIVARSSISAFDLVIAVAAGIAMTLVLLKRDVTAIVGVVVAASLVPVAAALGVVVALGEWASAGGAAFTLISNVCGILLGLTIGLRVSQLHGLTHADRRKGKLWGRRSIVAGSALAVALAGIAAWSFFKGQEQPDLQPTAWTETPGVLAVWTNADGTVTLAVDPKAFEAPEHLPAAAVVLAVTPYSKPTPDAAPPSDEP